MVPLRIALLVLAVTLAASAPARATGPDVVAAWEEEVARLDAEQAPLAEQRARLEARSRAESAEIERLKAQPAGISRDLRLGELLAAAQQRADELSRIAAELRPRERALLEARGQLRAACRAMVVDARVPADRRAAAARTLASLDKQLAEAAAAAPSVRVAPAAAVDPLEGPVELAERADRLHDDAAKLGREAERLSRRIEGLEERARLRERAAELNDDLFVEGSVGRRATRPVDATNTRGLADTASKGAVAPANSSPSGAFTGGDASTPAVALRGVVDPATLAELRRTEAGSDPERALAALKRARGELAERAAEMSRRETELRRRAADLRRNK